MAVTTPTPTERPLTAAEREALSSRIERAVAESRAALVKTGAASALVCGALAVLTRLASDAPWWVIGLFWSALGGLLTLWIGMPWRRLMRQQVPVLNDGLQANRAIVTRVQAARVVEFEEEEDEGACYAFELDAHTLIFIVGQEFYEDDDFPNSDFSMVDILGKNGRPIDTRLEKNGVKLKPQRMIPAAIKRQLEIPEHMSVVHAPLDTVEQALSR